MSKRKRSHSAKLYEADCSGSTAMESVTYQSGTITLEFQKGKGGSYEFDCTLAEYRRIANADSVGAAVNDFLG